MVLLLVDEVMTHSPWIGLVEAAAAAEPSPPVGWGPPAFRTPAHKWRTRVVVSTTCGAVSTRGSPLPSPVCRSCRGVEGFMIRRWDLIISEWRWLY